MRLQVFLEVTEITDESCLREKLKSRHKDKYGAFWLVDEEPILSLFINGENACLYFMPGDQGEDAWSKNPEFRGTEEDILDFHIENYQLDEIALENVVPTKKAVEAFVYFYKNRKLSPDVDWG